MPFFSIIIPTLNSAKTLPAALESILSQSFVDFEILIMDGLSNDNTREIAQSYEDARIYFFSEKDKGIYSAMNKGIELAKGEWVYFMGSDDFLYNEFILMQIYQYTQSTRYKIIYGNVIFKGNIGDSYDGRIYDGYFSLNKLLDTNICHQAIFYHKSIFSSIGHFNTDYILYADWDFNLRCKAKFKFVYFNVIIAFFSVYGTSSSLKDDIFYCDITDNITRYFKWQFYKKDFSSILIKILKNQIKKRMIGKAFLILIQLLLFHPKIMISYIKK